MGKGLSSVAALLLLTGCMIPKGGALPHLAEFEQRVFRFPPDAYRPLPDDTAVAPSHLRYGNWREAWAERIDYSTATGQHEQAGTTTQSLPLFMLDGKGAEHLAAALRSVNGGHTLLLDNRSIETQAVALHLSDYSARTALLNPMNGKTLVLRQEEDGSYRMAFAPGQKWLVCFGEFARHFIFDGIYAMPWPRKDIAALNGAWRSQRLDPNVLTLDSAQRLQDSLRYTATVADVPAVCKLAVKTPDRYSSVTVNGQTVTLSTNEFFRHKSFHLGDVTTLLKPGENRIELADEHGVDADSIHLVGDFAVKEDSSPTSRFSIVKERQPTFLRDLSSEGYPFYTGTFVMETTLDMPRLTRDARYLLTFPKTEGVILRVTVNNITFDPLFASPLETDITIALRPGPNTVRVELTNDSPAYTKHSPTPLGLHVPPVVVEISGR